MSSGDVAGGTVRRSGFNRRGTTDGGSSRFSSVAFN